MRLSIRWTLFFLFAVIVLGGGAISIYLGYKLTSEAVIGEAQRQVELDLRSAWVQYNRELERVQSVVRFSTMLQKTHDILLHKQGVTPEWVRERLEAIRKQYNLDVLTVVEPAGKVILRTRYPYTDGDTVYVDPVIQRALKRESASGTVIVPAEVLEIEGQFLKEQAFMEIEETPMAAPARKDVETSGMMIQAAEPVYSDTGEFIGFVYGGVLLNRNYAIPDSIRDTIFHNEQYKNRPLGNVTIFQGDLRIATNVLKKNSARAIGTLVSKVVNEMVLENGLSYYDRAFVVNDWYLTAYDPIRDPDNKVIGILYVGTLEKKYLDYKEQLTSSFLGMMFIGIMVSLLIAFAFAIWLSKPIKNLTKTADEMAAGNFLARVEGNSLFKDVERLNRAFNRMADAVVEKGNELFNANKKLYKSNEELTQLNQNYMDILEFVTHELKSPLASMIFGLDSLKHGYLGNVTPQQSKVLDAIEKNAEYLNEMILNYLNLSRIEKNELHFVPEEFPFKQQVIEPVLIQVANQLMASKMQVTVEVPDAVTVRGDRNLLKIVLDNLLSNAIKYGKEGSTIKIGYEPTAEGGHIFNVFNEGQGIPEKETSKLFQKFSRLNLSELRFKKGTGLGLFITREIVERHNGKIWAESKEREWANFIFELPVTPKDS